MCANVIETMGEVVDEGLQLIEADGQVVVGVELVARALVAFDRAVELGSFGWADVEGKVLCLAGGFEVGAEPRPSVDLNAFDRERRFGESLSRRVSADCAEALAATRPRSILATGSWAIKCLIGLSGRMLTNSVSICTPHRAVRPWGRWAGVWRGARRR